tara:strand:- start:261 stop:494 length:234 start_codon:yes stop_codon:yes gene_type:complete
MDIDKHKEFLNEQAIRFDGCDMAIIGYDHNGFIVYCYNRLLALFMMQGMGREDAIEWIDYNVLPTNAGQNFTLLYDH